MTVPTLILIGESDDWTPAEACRKLVDGQDDLGMTRLKRGDSPPNQLRVYPNAYHGLTFQTFASRSTILDTTLSSTRWRPISPATRFESFYGRFLRDGEHRAASRACGGAQAPAPAAPAGNRGGGRTGTAAQGGPHAHQKPDGGGKPRMGGGQREPRHDLQGGPSQAEEGVSPGPRARHSHPGALGAYHAFAHPKDTKSRRSERPLLDRASTYVPPTWQNGTRCRFASSQAQLSSWPNPHSTRGAAAARIPRFRALALFGRRPLERVDSPAIPASENLHKLGSQAAV
jgi:hypothetical protein